ncbi:isoprenoid synthase domain-containing protein [Boletus reticuloceps]|uniref:Terpene synthase n=1 Tax=Boletus reticuloceps TaxID=495285 RepID=A0A8I2YT34_9AGAM|nr:isoprenoid synthase domain-containing protein [Boletus reticuloceps]
MQAYHLPNFLAFLPKKPGGEISPYFKAADTGYNSWVHDKIGWLFAIADRCSSAEAVTRSQLWMKTLSQCDKGESSRHPFIRTMRRELVPNMKAVVDPFHWPQFLDSNVHFSKNTIQEALDRESHSKKDTVRDIQSYMVMRRETIGTRPCFVLMRSIRRLYIPDDVLAHPIIREMEDVALDMVFIVNDVYSFKKEYGDNGALNNLLTVMEKDLMASHMDLQTRLDHTEKLFTAALDRFHACRKELPSFNADLDRHVAAYADGLIDWIAGNIEWSSLNHRYKTFLNGEDRKNCIMKIELDNPHRKLRRSLLIFFVVLSMPVLGYVL